MKKITPDNVYLHGDDELDAEAQALTSKSIANNPQAQATASELESLQSLFKNLEQVEESETFVRATHTRLESESLFQQVIEFLQPAHTSLAHTSLARTSLEWSFASVLLLCGLVITQDNASDFLELFEEELSPLEELQDQDFIQALESEYSTANSDLLLFDMNET